MKAIGFLLKTKQNFQSKPEVLEIVFATINLNAESLIRKNTVIVWVGAAKSPVQFGFQCRRAKSRRTGNFSSIDR